VGGIVRRLSRTALRGPGGALGACVWIPDPDNGGLGAFGVTRQLDAALTEDGRPTAKEWVRERLATRDLEDGALIAEETDEVMRRALPDGQLEGALETFTWLPPKQGAMCQRVMLAVFPPASLTIAVLQLESQVLMNSDTIRDGMARAAQTWWQTWRPAAAG
jgi:hypothetical protein